MSSSLIGTRAAILQRCGGMHSKIAKGDSGANQRTFASRSVEIENVLRLPNMS